MVADVAVETLSGNTVQVPAGLVRYSMVWSVTGAPPLLVGAVQVAVSWVLPGVSRTLVGASGATPGVAVTAVEAVPVPVVLTAEIRTS
jgi:hypothetical protein